MTMSFLAEFFIIAALLISLSYVYGQMPRLFSKVPRSWRSLGIGIFFGIAGMVSMYMPFEMTSGVVLDARVVIIIHAAVFGGFTSSFISAAACGILGIFIGDYNGSVAVFTLISALLLGLPLRRIFLHIKSGHKALLHLFFALTGSFSAFIYYSSVFFLPIISDSADMFRFLFIPIFPVYTFLGYMTGILIKREDDQYEMEKELKISNERKSKALSIANDGYFEWNVKEEKLHFDSNYYQLAGYDPGEFEPTRKEWRIRVHPEDLIQVEEAMESCLRGQCDSYDETYRFWNKKGHWMWIHARAVALDRDSEGRALRILGTHTDLSDYKSAQLELKRLQSAIEYAAEAVLITDAKGIIQYINPSFSRITGYSREEAVGRNAEILRSGEHDGDFYRNLWETISSGKSWSGQIRNRKKDGSLYTVETVISPVFGERNKEIVNYVSIRRDITGDLNLQEQVEQSRKMQAIGQLAGGVAHDFNNMLTGIMTATLMLRKKISGDELSLKYLSIIDEAVNRSAELTKNLLSFSRKQPQLLRIIDLHESIGRIVKLLESTLDKSIMLNIDLCGENSSIVGDAAQIENAILNLCINASHAIDGGGEIGLETEIVHFDRDHCEREPFELAPGQYIHLAVSDNGKGMDPEILSKIFEPFFTTKAKTKGTGLGLTAVYTMIQQHKGSITVESTPGTGTVFHLYFYMIADEEESNTASTGDLGTFEGEGTILLVDDEKLISGPLEDMLRDSGYNVLVAENGLEAVELFRDKWKSIDLVILDVVMPVMDGLNCLIRLREINPAVPVIVETGYSSEEKISRMKEIGIQGLIKKPAAEELISRTITEVLCT